MASLVSVTLSPQQDGSLIESCAAQSKVTGLISWSQRHITVGHESDNLPMPDGAAFHCQNGTLYLFRTRRSQRQDAIWDTTAYSSELLQPSRASSSSHHQGLGIGRARSPSPAQSTFSRLQPSKSRIVSGVTTEQAEAPKTYVDYDDEPDKLKDLLKGKSRKDRSPMESRSPIVESTAGASDTTPPTPRSKLSIKHRTLLSATLSPASSAGSLSSPDSPVLLPSLHHPDELNHNFWALICHVFPPQSGVGQSISDMKVIGDGRYLICLRQCGRIEVLSTADGWCISSIDLGYVTNLESSTTTSSSWIWKSLVVVSSEASCVVVATAALEPSASSLATEPADNEDEDQCRIAVLQCRVPHEAHCDDVLLDKTAELTVSTRPEAVMLHQTNAGQLELIYVSSGNRLVKRYFTEPEIQQSHATEAAKTSSNVHLPVPNPFKSLMSTSTENLAAQSLDCNEGASFGEETDISSLPLDGSVQGIRMQTTARGYRALVWSHTQILGFECSGEDFQNLFIQPMNDIRDIQWNRTNTFTIVLKDHAEIYRLINVDSDNDLVSVDSSDPKKHNVQPYLMHSSTLLPSDAYTITPAGHVLSTRVKRGRRRLEYTSLDDSAGSALSYTLWSARDIKKNKDGVARITTTLPFELENLILGYSDGHIRRSSLQDVTRDADEGNPKNISDLPLPGDVLSIHLAVNGRTGERLLIGGADDGGIAIWDLESLRLLARWTVFINPLSRVLVLQTASWLRGCVFCISQDGTIAVIALDEYQFLYLIPPSTSPLTKVCLNESELLLYYADGRARLWDTKTREFWRSLTAPKADELVLAGEWSESILNGPFSQKRFISALPNSCRTADGESTLLLDMEMYLVELGLNSVPPGTKATGASTINILSPKLDDLRTILSVLLTSGLDGHIDRLCTETLGVPRTSVPIGLSIRNVTAIYADTDPKSVWSISPELSAFRASTIVALLQTLLQCEGAPSDLETIVAFYTVALGQLIGESYQAPSLPLLARIWLETPANALRYAAHLLFEAGIARLADADVIKLIDSWHSDLPSQQPEPRNQRLRNAIALFICGHVAVSRYALLSTSHLTDIAKSVALYLHDETSPYRALGIDIGSRGFAIWQQYVDVVQMLRALFTLATSSRKETPSVHNVGQLARSAVLQLASTNTPLFMTTLSMDILHPRNVQHRKSIMELVIFLIRKKPLVLYSNLPRLVEAVVKSLDPNSTASREAVLDSATEILGHVVRSFPTVDFHMGSQRLAVGTSEGAVIMYDLKTATRLYVLEGHKKRTTACSFSPDGRRLVTMSLEECVVLVWKVGSSFSSLFNPGAPPRQGHGGSEPFKTLSFAVDKDAARMSILETFDLVRFEWTAERSVKLHIRHTVFTFST
ncbi:unnamed protein product [Somion occarium]|uniref:WD40 repeat-like protein n=1 Tax=Somion occarium TaxID=3059160 RepID=A0ABP1E0Q4_9APHY